MESEFNVLLTGTEGEISGIAKRLNPMENPPAYEFISQDDSVHLMITKEDGRWIRLGGTEPYLTSWPEELATQIQEQLG